MSREATQFKKGQSGNPSGRPKALKELEEACRGRLTDVAIDRLEAVLSEKDRDGNPTPSTAVHMKAVEIALAYGYGKPRQVMEVTGADGGPLQSIGLTTNDPVEAARAYQRIVSGG